VPIDGLDRDEELLDDFLVLMATSDEPHHLTLTRTEPLKLLINHRDLTWGTKSIQDKACQSGTEQSIATGYPENDDSQVPATDGLDYVAVSPSSDDRDHIL